jgi:hypothetical protein
MVDKPHGRLDPKNFFAFSLVDSCSSLVLLLFFSCSFFFLLVAGEEQGGRESTRKSSALQDVQAQIHCLGGQGERHSQS